MRGSTGLLTALSLLWGSSWIANQTLAGQGAPLVLAAERYAFAACLLASIAAGGRWIAEPWLTSRRRRSEPEGLLRLPAASAGTPNPGASAMHDLAPPSRTPSRLEWLRVNCLLGVTMLGVPGILLVWAAEHGAGAWTPLVYACLPLGLLIFAGKLRPAAIVAVGAMLVLLNGSLPVGTMKLVWVLPIAAAVALQGWSLIYARKHLPVAAPCFGVSIQLAMAAAVQALGASTWVQS